MLLQLLFSRQIYDILCWHVFVTNIGPLWLEFEGEEEGEADGWAGGEDENDSAQLEEGRDEPFVDCSGESCGGEVDPC